MKRTILIGVVIVLALSLIAAALPGKAKVYVIALPWPGYDLSSLQIGDRVTCTVTKYYLPGTGGVVMACTEKAVKVKPVERE